MILKFASILVLSSLLSPTSTAQDFVVAQSQTEERHAGLLALPEVFGEYPCELFEVKKLDLYATAASQRPPIATIERLNPPKPPNGPECEEPQVVVRRINDNSVEELPMDESGYEHTNAVVYQQSGNWFRIAVPGGSAWIERPNADGFMSYPEALASQAFLTYLRPGWDGNIWSNPGVGMGAPAPAVWRAHVKEEIPVRVTSTQIVNGEKWIRVRFENEICGNSLGNLPALETWLPAYRPSRATSVWFYSRGC